MTAPSATTSAVDPDLGTPYDLPNTTPSAVDIGPFTVTGAAGSTVSLTLDPAAGFTGTGPTQTVTGQGVLLSLQGFSDASVQPSTLVAGPLPVVCNPPSTGTPAQGQTLASIPVGSVTGSPAPPVVTVQPGDTIVDAGQPASFTAAASGNPAPNVQWQVSTDGGQTWSADTTDAGTATDVLTVNSVTAVQNGNEYRAVFTNSQGNATSGAARLSVSSAPIVTQNPSNVTALAPTAATFTAAATGIPAPTVQWQVSTDGGQTWSNDTSDAGATTGTLTVSPTAAAENGNEYRAVFTNRIASQASAAATLTVGANGPPIIITNPSDGLVVLGAPATFTAAATTAPTTTVQWQVSTDGGQTWSDDTSDGGVTTDTLTVSPTTVAENGDRYRASSPTSTARRPPPPRA